MDWIIRNGFVIDGTGMPRHKADVGITAGKITAIGDLSATTSTQEIDASDKICLLYTSDAADDTPCVDLGGKALLCLVGLMPVA